MPGVQVGAVDLAVAEGATKREPSEAAVACKRDWLVKTEDGADTFCVTALPLIICSKGGGVARQGRIGNCQIVSGGGKQMRQHAVLAADKQVQNTPTTCKQHTWFVVSLRAGRFVFCASVLSLVIRFEPFDCRGDRMLAPC